MSFDLNVKVKTKVSAKDWQNELRKHLIDFSFDKSIDREKRNGFLPVEWTSESDDIVSSGFEVSFDHNLNYLFSSGSSGHEFAAAWMSAATLTQLGNGVLTDPQAGTDLNGDTAIKHAIAILLAYKESEKTKHLEEQSDFSTPVPIEMSDEDVDVLFEWLVKKKILKDLKSRKARAEKINSLRKFEPKADLGEIPAQFRFLKNLEELDISFQNYKQLPKWIGDLTSLKSFKANNNKLSTLEPRLFELKQLEELDLNSNQLTELPEEIAQLSTLKQLDVSQNSIDRIPDSIGNLVRLGVLNVLINKISVLPVSLTNCRLLFDLRVSGNSLVQLPGWIGNFPHLKLLIAQSCGLTQLPESIGQLSSLEFLGVSYNSLTEMPASIAKLSRLRRIEATDNQLKTLPETIVNLGSLESLDLANNRQLKLTKAIEKLPKLTELSVSSGAVTSDMCNRLENKDPMCWVSFN